MAPLLRTDVVGHTQRSGIALSLRFTVKCAWKEYSTMTKISVEVPDELLDDLDEHVGQDKKFVNRSEAIRASIRKTLDLLDDIDARHGRLEEDP